MTSLAIVPNCAAISAVYTPGALSIVEAAVPTLAGLAGLATSRHARTTVTTHARVEPWTPAAGTPLNLWQEAANDYAHERTESNECVVRLMVDTDAPTQATIVYSTPEQIALAQRTIADLALPETTAILPIGLAWIAFTHGHVLIDDDPSILCLRLEDGDHVSYIPTSPGESDIQYADRLRLAFGAARSAHRTTTIESAIMVPRSNDEGERGRTAVVASVLQTMGVTITALGESHLFNDADPRDATTAHLWGGAVGVLQMIHST